MEHFERAGVHSGDSISIYPSINIEKKHKDTLVRYTESLAKNLAVLGLVNIQFVLYNDQIYVIEVNPRSSRTVPYISKVTGVPMVDLATRCMFGEKLRDMGCGTPACIGKRPLRGQGSGILVPEAARPRHPARP